MLNYRMELSEEVLELPSTEEDKEVLAKSDSKLFFSQLGQED